MNSERTKEEQEKEALDKIFEEAKATILKQIAECNGTEDLCSLVMTYYNQGVKDGVKAGAARILVALKNDMETQLEVIKNSSGG